MIGSRRWVEEKAVPRSARSIARARGGRTLSPEQEQVWEKAAAFCVRHFPTLWTAGEPRQDGQNRWFVPIVLRYPGGYEGTLGEMTWDEQRQDFVLLTDRAGLSERAGLIASSRSANGSSAAAPETGA
jgi:hypothetical protein